MRSIAIITARGGSKRIPKKNIKDFCGRPIISYSIQAALESKLFDEVMVSTDSDEIAQIATQYGARVPFLRSPETSSDTATTSEVIQEVLDRYETEGEYFDTACCIYPTAPFMKASHLVEASEILADKEADIVIPMAAFSYPPQRGMVQGRDGSVKMVHPEYRNSRSQDLEPIYHDCGQYYFFSVPKFKVNQNIMCGRIVPIIISQLEMQDIDNESDWKLAELKYRLLVEKDGLS